MWLSCLFQQIINLALFEGFCKRELFPRAEQLSCINKKTFGIISSENSCLLSALKQAHKRLARSANCVALCVAEILA